LNKSNQYEWLIIVEGSRDVSVYNEYLTDVPCKISGLGGKSYSINMSSWDSKSVAALRNDLGRTGFKGVIIIVDSDNCDCDPFAKYCRTIDLPYIGSVVKPQKDSTGSYWLLDSMRGLKSLPVRGVNVPRDDNGCLETDLLTAYGFPVEKQIVYTTFVNIIKKASTIWKIPNNNDNKPWWEINEKAKMDKFIYAALREGFCVSDKKPVLPKEPNVISNLRKAMA